MNQERNVYTVSRLNREVRLLLEQGLPGIWVEGEISNFARPSSGHWYFSLKDRDAQIRCAMFRQKNGGVKFQPKDGLSVIAREDKLRANADLYKRFVDVSLQGWDEARRNQQAAAAAVNEAFPSVTVPQVLGQLAVNVRFLCAPGAPTLGRVPDANWQRTYQLMIEYLEFPRERPVTDYYSNDYLPARAPACS